jgi:hypothetical protein
VKVSMSVVPSASPVNPGPTSLLTSSVLGKTRLRLTMLTKPAASGSDQGWPGPKPESPVAAIDQRSGARNVTLRGFPFKVAVSDVEEFSVMTREAVDYARTHWLRDECGGDCYH